jgi:hypothetical protein
MAPGTVTEVPRLALAPNGAAWKPAVTTTSTAATGGLPPVLQVPVLWRPEGGDWAQLAAAIRALATASQAPRRVKLACPCLACQLGLRFGTRVRPHRRGRQRWLRHRWGRPDRGQPATGSLPGCWPWEKRGLVALPRPQARHALVTHVSRHPQLQLLHYPPSGTAQGGGPSRRVVSNSSPRIPNMSSPTVAYFWCAELGHAPPARIRKPARVRVQASAPNPAASTVVAVLRSAAPGWFAFQLCFASILLDAGVGAQPAHRGTCFMVHLQVGGWVWGGGWGGDWAVAVNAGEGLTLTHIGRVCCCCWPSSYGANMNAATLKLRKVNPIGSSEPAVLNGWMFRMSYAGVPFVEPAFASVHPASSGASPKGKGN